MMEYDYDLIIVGAGVVGCSLACALLDSDLRVLLINAEEKPRPPAPDAPVHPRVSAINLGCQRFLDQVGVWRGIPAQRRGGFAAMEVWDAVGRGRIRFDSFALGQEFLGFVVENPSLHAALRQRLAESAITVFDDCPVTSVTRKIGNPAGNLVMLENGDTLTCTVLVGADGAASTVRRGAGITATSRDYQHTALVATISVERHHNGIARQVFLADGPLALLPLANGQCSIVWSTTPGEAEWLREMSAEEFGEELGKASEYCLGGITGVGERLCFPLRSLQAESYCREGVALVGDAAHVFHPLAGLGVNLGIADALSLAAVLQAARLRGEPLGGLPVLRRYERWRRSDNGAVIHSVDAIKWLFQQQGSWPRLRRAGMSLGNHSGPAKRWLIRQALGLGAGQPTMKWAMK